MEQVELLARTIATLESRHVPYMLVGSLASTAYGEPRMTRDIDIVVDLRPDQVEHFCDAFPEDEYYVSRPAATEAVLHAGQFNVIHPSSGNKIDFIVARKDAWGQEQLRRRRRVLLAPGLQGYTASPEDVIVGKLWYYRKGGSEKHLRDVGSMLDISGAQIDRSYIDHWVERLGLGAAWKTVLSQRERD